MSLFDVICLCLINLLSFTIGAKIGQSSANNKNIVLNPIKNIKDDIEQNKKEKKDKLSIRRMETMLSNIDSYDGTGIGQKQIPKE